ncbi:MAG: prepilin-type N-terminal cleavage/methylation domain-containing protein [Phycisphaerae bacterium]
MSGSVKKSGLTLLELVIVMTLMALAVGVSTIGLPGLSDQGRLESAAAQLGNVIRLASCTATRSGLPRMLAFDDHGCTVKKPVRRDGTWAWSSGSRIDLIPKVRITGVSDDGADRDRRAPQPPWMVLVQPGTRHVRHVFTLELSNGKRAAARTDALTGLAQVELEARDWDQ